MKTIYKGLVTIALLTLGFSCADPDLDPMQIDNIKKGTILALRGAALDALYTKGKPIAELFPRIINGSEKFVYETEYLAEDPSTLASVDLYVMKSLGGGNFDRKLVKTVEGSAFTKGAYPNPSTTIEIGITEVLGALGLGTTYPLGNADVNTLLTTYKFGINLESDINLKDGSKVEAKDIVAAGLFQSNIFYPSMRLSWTVTDYCPYSGDWSGVFSATEVYSDGAYGPYDITLKPVAGSANTYSFDNFWDSGIDAYIVFTPSTNPNDAIVLFPSQDDGDGKTISSTSGSYNECTRTFKIQTQYAGYDWRYEFKAK